ncbi:MAG: insulinase family protein [Acidimicrobiaceae bacterium]|nr:insulinase family protein [Acidimicrobiaceae bacterium]MCY4176440.1 insulinase family protein [Acidimicrobiaceae bacterium]MCY4294428.1 insulinase family protein [Acidimicrobiaceae bacterium]
MSSVPASKVSAKPVRAALMRRSIVLFMGAALAASLLAPAATAQPTTAPSSTPTTDEHSFHQEAVAALSNLAGEEIFAGTGCADGDGLCADEPLLRWELAVWLVRNFDRNDPAAIDDSRFADVDPAVWWAPYAERLAELGFAPTCSDEPLNFCGGEPITRGETASVLVSAFKLGPSERLWFADVNSEHPHVDAISRLAAARITAGCHTSPARFCPDHDITRGQAAALLAVARHLLPRPRRIDATDYIPAQDHSLLPVDDEVVIGALDNGLTYYLRHNDSPGGNLAVRLVINVGSVDETDAQAGIAHYVEHMLFNGTTEFPGLSLGAALREIGVELGPDLNAHVGHDETVYQVEVRLDEDHKAPLVFNALSQMAGSASFTPGAVDSERGVILDEMRLAVESLSGYVGREFDRIYTSGTPYEGRDPIGNLDTVSSFSAADLRAFYSEWYVPANMAVVAVGDMEVSELEALVQEHFGPLPASPGRIPPNIRITPNPESSSHVITDPRHSYSYISLDIPIDPLDLATAGGARLSTMETLIAVMLENRLNDAYQRGELSQVDPPSFGSFVYNRGLRYYGTNWQGDNLDTASTDYLNVLLTAQEHGFTDGDLERAVSALRAGLEFRLESEATTQDREWAGRYQNHFLYGVDISAAEVSVARTLALLEAVTAAELTEHFRWQMNRGGLLAIAVGADSTTVPTEAELDAAWAAASPGPPPPEVVVITELMAEPEPVSPTAEAAVELVEGGYEWTFANGARVMFAPSEIAEGEVNLTARSLGGWSLLDPGGRAVSGIAVDAVSASGLGELSKSQLDNFLADRAVVVNPYISESTEGFSAASSTDDVDIMFQMIHLLVTEPRVNDPAFADAVNTAETRLGLSETNSPWQAAVAYLEARYGTTWHRFVANRDEIAAVTPQSLLELYKSRLSSVDDLTVAVVGDIDAATIADLAARYIGTLPAGESDTYINRQRPSPDELVQRRVMAAAGETGVLEIYYEAEVPVTPLTSVAADVLETALSERAFLTIREGLGTSYTAGAGVAVNRLPRHYVDSSIYATFDPQRYEEVHSTMLDLIADVAADGLTDEEFQQAVSVATSNYVLIRNSHLLGALISRSTVDEDQVLTQQRRLALLSELTPADVQALAAELYGSGGRIEIITRP